MVRAHLGQVYLTTQMVNSGALSGQALPYKDGTNSFTFFSIGSTNYLALGKWIGATPGTTHVFYLDTASDQWLVLQEILTLDAITFLAFSINDETYLAAASWRNNTLTADTVSTIYRWNGAQFEAYQSFDTGTTTSWSNFTVTNDDGSADYYLVLSITFSDITGYNTTSHVYKWNHASGFFDLVQQLPTVGAHFAKAFWTVDGQLLLAITQYYDGSTYNVPALVFRWTGGRFELLQSLPAMDGHYVTHFVIGSTDYLGLTNFYNHNQVLDESVSVLYTWNVTARQFDVFQTISTVGANNIRHVNLGGNDYLLIANDSGASSLILIWDGVQFEPLTFLNGYMIRDMVLYAATNGRVYYAVGGDAIGGSWQAPQVFRVLP